MKRLFSILLVIVLGTIAMAQVPYFGNTPGNKKLYGYTSVKFRPGINSTESYNTFQYGITDYAAMGVDFYAGFDNAYMGYMLRAGYKINQWFSVGGTATPSFDLNDNFKFDYFTGGVFMNGSITKDARLFWCTNTWFNVNRGSSCSIQQYSYLGYEFAIKNGDTITPMFGLDHSWRFDENPDMAIGFYYTHKEWNIYVWGNDLCKSNPRVVVGVDFKF